jgi:predicted oxidoreductase
MSTEQKICAHFSVCGGDAVKVTIPEITDKDLADLLKRSGMTDDEVKSFLERCENSCCAEKVRLLRKTRNALLDSIHEKQAVLDKLDNLIWNIEHGGAS